MTLEPIKYERGSLSILDQLLLPAQTKFIEVATAADGWRCIHNMNVRGAPAIALVGTLSVAVELDKMTFDSKKELADHVIERLQYLVTARPTAVNMKRAADDVKLLVGQLLEQDDISMGQMREKVLTFIEAMLKKDVEDNMAIGEHGARDIEKVAVKKPIRILTHCNTGSLATAKYGTALGVVRKLWSNGTLDHAFCTETRPYNQGARLTAYELVYEGIPATLVCDDMAAWLMKNKDVSAVVVGADRVVANGDTANKIGTYQLAILAKFHDIPFYVAAPTTTIDFNIADGAAITIEERPGKEMTHIQGIEIAAPGINCWNPAFDVTPAALITGGIITEFGVFPANKLSENINSS